MINRFFAYCGWLAIALYVVAAAFTGCAQIGYPTGGKKDSIPPVLVSAVPAERSTNFTGNKIVLSFDEYIDVRDVQTNVMVSPYPKTMPLISTKLKTVTIKLKDSLLPNTTYAIDFGNSLADLNEGNPFRNYTYVFSTGTAIDSLQLSGNVLLAESGKSDSTLVAMLYRNAVDSSVQHRKPDYLAKLNAKGDFKFINLSPGTYKLYALKDGDDGKTYNSPIELFAFASEDIAVTDSVRPVTLFAYAEEKDTRKTGADAKPAVEKKLKLSVPVNEGAAQDLLSPLKITFNRSVKEIDSSKIQLTDTLFRKIKRVQLSLDSTRKILTLSSQWIEAADYILVVDKDAVTDTAGNKLSKSDTIRFKTKSNNDYGNLLLRFKNYDAGKHPVLQFLKGEEMLRSVRLSSDSWGDKLFPPGEYDLRILYDDNNNGKWDPGSYKEKRQPEKAVTLPKKLTVKAGWDNEKEIEL